MKQLNKKPIRLLALMFLSLVWQTSASGQLNGTYTVYGTTPSYATLQAAATALSAGVSGPVTFKIRPGTWTDVNTVIASIGNIAGASATNTITFEAENGSAATTILQNTNTSTTAGTNNIFYLNGAKYVRIRNLTLNKNNVSAGNCIRFAADAQNNIIENCVLTGTATTASSINTARIYGTSLATASGNIIRNNTIISGTYGIYWSGTSTAALSDNNEFSGNTITEPYGWGMYVYYTNNVKVQTNNVTRTLNPSVVGYGFQVGYPYNQGYVDGNTVTMTGGTTTNYGVYVLNMTGTAALRGSVSNNVVTITSSSTVYGVNVETSTYHSVIGNKATLTGTSTGSMYPLRNYNTTTTLGVESYVNNNQATALGGGTMEVWGHYYCTNGEFNNNKIILGDATKAGTRAVYTGYQTSTGSKCNNNDITMISTTGTMNLYAIYSGVTNGECNNNLVNIGVPASTGASTIYMSYSGITNGKCNSNTITANTNGTIIANIAYSGTSNEGKDNKIVLGNSTSTGGRTYSTGYSGTSMLASGNDVTLNSTSGALLVQAVYSGTVNSQFLNNKVTLNSYANTSTQYMRIGYSSNTNAVVNGNTLTMSNTSSGSQYIYGLYSGNVGNVEYSNNTVNMSTTSGTNYHYGVYSNTTNAGYAKANGNKVTMTATSSATLYSYMLNSSYAAANTVNEAKNNVITMSATSSGSAYNYLGNGCDGGVITGNICDIRAGTTTYGLYCTGYTTGSRPWTIANNKITVFGGSSTTYGLRTDYCHNSSIYNNVVFAKGTSTVYGFYTGYNRGTGASIYNNTVHTESSTTHYTFYCYQTALGEFASVKNNVFSRTGTTGYLIYIYNALSMLHDMDYNNFWNNGTTMMYVAYNGTTYANLTALRTSFGWCKNSVSYNPGFISATTPDLRPNPATANSWSLNGRGVQIAGNNTDIAGAARAVTTAAGVPDIGAYEFTPTVTPPNCTLTPAAPVANGTQIVTFGEDTVAVLKWGTALPTGFAVRQYTGTNPPGILSLNPTQMFYYADFVGNGTLLDYQQDLYYKDPWLGTLGSKSAMRLAEKVGANPWAAYLPANSSSNTTRNFIHTPSVMNVGTLFTGVDIANNASADAIIEPVPPFCAGTYTVKLRVKNNGTNIINSLKIDWTKDGGPISTINYNTPINVNGSGPGNEAIITLGNITFGAAGVKIKAWTYLPNGVSDPISMDDTLNEIYFAALSGVYTVGGTTPDFPTVVAATTALTKFGTCGDVTFNIRPGTYTGQVVVNNPLRAPSTNGRITYQAENGNATSVTINHSTTITDFPVIQLINASNMTFRKLTVASAATYGRCIEINGKSSNDSILGCVLNAPNTTSSTSNSAICGYSNLNSFSGDNLVIKGNIISGGYYSLYIYGYNGAAVSYLNGMVIDSNTFTPYYYAGNIYYTNGLKFTNNNMVSNFATTGGGPYIYYAVQSPKITGNDIQAKFGYGMYIYQPGGSNATSDKAIISNNSVALIPGGSTSGGLFVYYPNNTNIYNNSVYATNTYASCYATWFYSSSTSYSNNSFRNNASANVGGGYAWAWYNSGGTNNTSDYNNIYATATNAVYNGGTGIASTYNAYRTAENQDAHSITYNPGFTGATDLHPDKLNPASWSLNGRGVHIVGNNTDKEGIIRVEARADGVPDIGAYEFVPESVPPAATASPALADPGDTQIFTFGGNEVGRITWGLSAPSAPVTVRQYSGEKGSGIAAAASPSGSMYFHTDVTPSGNLSSFDFDLTTRYMDIWLGDIVTESNLRLAHKVTGYPWMVYSGALSSVNTTDKNITGTQLNRFGAFTGLENGSIPSAFVRPQGRTIICIGSTLVLNAEPQNGDYYKWYFNNTAIPGAEGPAAKSYTASQAGDYSVAITFSGKVVESVPVTVSTIAAPNALVSANGPLTYCAGNGLTLDAGSNSGVKYQWQLNGNNIPGATNSTFPVNQAGNYTVVVTNIGCSSTSVPTPVTSGPLSVKLGNDTSYCEIKNVWMKLDAGYPGAKYHWNTGDTSKVIEVKQGGKYWVQVDGGPNCIGTDTINVTIDPLPKANGISFVQSGNTYQFFPSGPVGAVGFLWIFSDGTTSTQNSPTKVVDGDLYVRLVMFNACGSDTVQLGWPLTVQSVLDEQSVNVYPNPAKDKVTISIDGAELQSVEVLNSVGSVVYRADVTGTQHSVDVSVMANGHYMLRATTTNGTVNRQFDILK